MLKFISFAISEITAILFAAYLGYFLYYDPSYMPLPENGIEESFIFCAICAGYWWFQSGTLALSGVKTAIAMATDILVSIVPILVVGYALLDFSRGNLALSEFKTYSAFFALGILLLDITFNSMIMARLSRRYLGEVQ